MSAKAALPGTITIRGARFPGHHGVTSAEQRVGGQYEVDLVVECDLARAARTDRLAHAVNYERLLAIVAAVVTGERHRLLERVASRIAGDVLAHVAAVQRVSVSVRKLHPPLGSAVAAVEVALTRSRERR